MQAGLTPRGYVAKVAVDVATARVRPVPTAVDAIGELLAARYQVQKFSALVNQAVAKWHSTEQVPAQLLAAVGLVGRVLPRLEEAAAVRVSQLDAGRRRVLAPRKAKTEPAGTPVGAAVGETVGAPDGARPGHSTPSPENHNDGCALPTSSSARQHGRTARRHLWWTPRTWSRDGLE